MPAPVPSITPPAAPGGQSGGSGSGSILPLPGDQVAEIVNASSVQPNGTAPSGAGGGREAEGDRSRGAAGGRGARAHTMPYRKRLRLVRALRGCLDRLPERQSDALILRYGVGDLRRQRSRQAADALNVSVERFRAIHRRGMRNLVSEARRSGCEHGGVAGPTMDSAVTAAWQAMVEDAVGTTVAARGDAGPVRNAVLGVRESGREETAGGGGAGGSDGGGPGPDTASVFDGLPFETDGALFLLLLAAMLAGATWIIMSFVRALR
jgi:hypothetical protein